MANTSALRWTMFSKDGSLSDNRSAKDASMPTDASSKINNAYDKPDYHSCRLALALATTAASRTVNRAVHRFYRRWAVFVSRYAFAIIVCCAVASLIGTANILKTKRRNNIRGYTPYGSRALYEFDVRDEFYAQSGTGIRFIAIIVPRDAPPPAVRRAADGSSYIVQDDNEGSGRAGNLLGDEALAEIIRVDDIVKNDILIYNRLTRQNESFSQICRLFCEVNDPVRAFYSGWRFQSKRRTAGETTSSRLNLSYPVSEVFGREINLLPNFFDVQMRGNVSRRSLNNSEAVVTTSRSQFEIERLGMVVLLYRAERIGGWTDDDIFNYEMSVHNHFNRNFSSEHIRVMTISSSYVAQEVDRAGQILRLYVMIGLGVMIVCAIVTCTLSAVYARQMSGYKVVLAVFACICPFLASGTALGCLFFCGMRHSSILSVTPFLILALGVDDAFLTIHAWQNVYVRYRHDSTVLLSIESRLAIVLEETGPAILISALTNILADTIGAFTGSPEITLLCLANIASILVDFFYQITFFTAVLILVARIEETGSLWISKPQSSLPSEVADIFEGQPSAVINPSAKVLEINRPLGQQEGCVHTVIDRKATEKNGQEANMLVRLRAKFAVIVDGYVRAVTNLTVAAGVCAAWAIFLVFCLQAMLGFEINLTTHKLFVEDSPLLEMEIYREERILPAYTMAQLFINRPGNLSDGRRRAALDRLVTEMEALPNAIGRAQKGTLYFMRDFVAFEESLVELDGQNQGWRPKMKDDTNATVMPNNESTTTVVKSKSSHTVTEKGRLTTMSKVTTENLTTATWSTRTTPSRSIINIVTNSGLLFSKSHTVPSVTPALVIPRPTVATPFLDDRRREGDLNGLINHRSRANRLKREFRDVRSTVELSIVDINIESDLKAFLDWPEYKYWRTFLKYHSIGGDRLALDSAMIIVGFHGEELRDWYKRAQMLTEWRQCVDTFGADFNASVLHDEGLYLDLLGNMTTDIWQSLAGTLACMAAVCALFMNSSVVVAAATTIIASIMIATLGIMALMGMTIDPVVMAAVIISIGFSVDIPTHISYHFRINNRPYSAEDGTNEKVGSPANRSDCQERIRQAFHSVGFPAIQASICMNICVLSFIVVPVYIAQVFIRVMCLCSMLCAAHSFVLLPSLFTVIDALTSVFTGRSRHRRNTIMHAETIEKPVSF